MPKYADRIQTMQASADIVRNLFNSMTDPETISFGGGAPAQEALPIDIVREITNEVMTKDALGVTALQYGNPIGLRSLRKWSVSTCSNPRGSGAVRTRCSSPPAGWRP